MKDNSDNLLKFVAPHLEEHLKNLRKQKDDIDTKIHEIEKYLSEIGHNNGLFSQSAKKRRPKGANENLLRNWFKEHPQKLVGQAEIATETGIRSSSARSVLDKLTKQGFLERDDSLWRLKQLSQEEDDMPF